MIRVRVLAIVSLGAANACVASKGDIRLLQDEMRSLRTSVAHADTTQRAQADTALRLIARANDSLRALSTRVNSFQASVSGELFEMGRQLLQIQELTGQSQRRIQELRAAWEARAEAAAVAAPVPGATGTGTDSTGAAAAPAQPAGPGSYQLFILSLDQLRRGSYGTAREGFQQLLDQYPTFEDAATAQLYIGESFAQERNEAAADSVYQVVVSKYPRSPQAPNALYKRALLLKGAGKEADARTILQRIVKDYPRSDEAELARDLLAAPAKK
jgi:tol-pal system protein YbgF